MSFDRAALRLGAAGQVGTRRGARIAHGGYARRRPCLRCNSASSSCGVRIAVTGTHSNDSRCADHDSKQAGEDCDAQLAAQPRRSAEVTELGMKIRIENHGLLPRHRRSNATALKPFPQACRPSPPADLAFWMKFRCSAAMTMALALADNDQIFNVFQAWGRPKYASEVAGELITLVPPWPSGERHKAAPSNATGMSAAGGSRH